MLLKNRFLVECRSKSFCKMSLHLWKSKLFVWFILNTKGHGYINLTTTVPIVRADPVPGCLFHLTMRLNTVALWARLPSMPDTTTQCRYRVKGFFCSVTTGYRISRVFTPSLLQMLFLHVCQSLKCHTIFCTSLECAMQGKFIIFIICFYFFFFISSMQWHRM